MTTNGSAANERGFRKTREGIVTSDKMDKTVVVVIQDQVKHALYSKVLSRSSKLKAHDETNSASPTIFKITHERYSISHQRDIRRQRENSV